MGVRYWVENVGMYRSPSGTERIWLIYIYTHIFNMMPRYTSNIIKYHQISDIIKYHQISPNIIKYHQISSHIIKYHQMVFSTISHFWDMRPTIEGDSIKEPFKTHHIDQVQAPMFLLFATPFLPQRCHRYAGRFYSWCSCSVNICWDSCPELNVATCKTTGWVDGPNSIRH
jgi:hypothetical protein